MAGDVQGHPLVTWLAEAESQAETSLMSAEAIQPKLRDEVAQLLADASTMLLSQAGTYSWGEMVDLVGRMQGMISVLYRLVD